MHGHRCTMTTGIDYKSCIMVGGSVPRNQGTQRPTSLSPRRILFDCQCLVGYQDDLGALR